MFSLNLDSLCPLLLVIAPFRGFVRHFSQGAVQGSVLIVVVALFGSLLALDLKAFVLVCWCLAIRRLA